MIGHPLRSWAGPVPYTHGSVADFPFPSDPSLRDRLEECIDPDGKIPRALEALGPLAGRDVVLLDADGGWRARQLVGLGARVLALTAEEADLTVLSQQLRAALASGMASLSAGTGLATGLPDGSADAVVSFWTGFRGGSDEEVAEAERILRPGGRLLVVHEYARDDLSRLRPDAVAREAIAWSRRDGWFLLHGFKIRILHAWWRFPDLEAMRVLVEAVFGGVAAQSVARVSRPRLSWKVVVYHRDRLAGQSPNGG